MVDISRRGILKAALIPLILNSKVHILSSEVGKNVLAVSSNLLWSSDIIQNFVKLLTHLDKIKHQNEWDKSNLIKQHIEEFEKTFFEYTSSLKSSNDRYHAFALASPQVTIASFIKIFPDLEENDKIRLLTQFIHQAYITQMNWETHYISFDIDSWNYNIPLYRLNHYYFSLPETERNIFYQTFSKVFNLCYWDIESKKRFYSFLSSHPWDTLIEGEEHISESDILKEIGEDSILKSLEEKAISLKDFLESSISNFREILEDLKDKQWFISNAELNRPLDILRGIFDNLDTPVKSIFQDIINNRYVWNISLVQQLWLPDLNPDFQNYLSQENSQFLQNFHTDPSPSVKKEIHDESLSKDENLHFARMKIIALLKNKQ